MGDTTPAPEADRPVARVAFVDSGIGLLAYADALLTLRADLGLVLALDPDHMPYGPRGPQEVQRLILDTARAALAHQPDAVVVACNTASVHGLQALRAELEPAIPVVGTVPAIRPAAAAGGPVAVWATAATTSSDYLRGLVDAFAADVETHAVAAIGLAEAIETANDAAIDACLDRAVAATPPGVRALVLGCTHYGLIADRIAAAVGESVTIYDSPVAVARQTLRRLGLPPAPDAVGGGVEAVLLSGRPGRLPDAVLGYPAARRLTAPQSAAPRAGSQVPAWVARGGGAPSRLGG